MNKNLFNYCENIVRNLQIKHSIGNVLKTKPRKVQMFSWDGDSTVQTTPNYNINVGHLEQVITIFRILPTTKISYSQS